jgi:hypothetical protein
MTTKQPVLDELHAVREQMLSDAGGSLAALIAKLRADQSKSGREIRKSPKTMRCTGAAKPGSLIRENLLPPDER